MKIPEAERRLFESYAKLHAPAFEVDVVLKNVKQIVEQIADPLLTESYNTAIRVVNGIRGERTAFQMYFSGGGAIGQRIHAQLQLELLISPARAKKLSALFEQYFDLKPTQDAAELASLQHFKQAMVVLITPGPAALKPSKVVPPGMHMDQARPGIYYHRDEKGKSCVVVILSTETDAGVPLVFTASCDHNGHMHSVLRAKHNAEDRWVDVDPDWSLPGMADALRESMALALEGLQDEKPEPIDWAAERDRLETLAWYIFDHERCLPAQVGAYCAIGDDQSYISFEFGSMRASYMNTKGQYPSRRSVIALTDGDVVFTADFDRLPETTKAEYIHCANAALNELAAYVARVGKTLPCLTPYNFTIHSTPPEPVSITKASPP
jgi:hypothetical protein